MWLHWPSAFPETCGPRNLNPNKTDAYGMQEGVLERAHVQNAQRLEQPETENGPDPTAMSGQMQNVSRPVMAWDDRNPFLTPMRNIDKPEPGVTDNTSQDEHINELYEDSPVIETEEEMNAKFAQEWEEAMAAARLPPQPPPQPPLP
ncbi:hypothetical protein B0H17DRAFT_1133968 [Mycena rosella]|uniref:Uncharacterized protein n=1 Tax=Mycena rosella TaxID=1033263 RepID=A0AAD7GJR8_MYCRO|nr:hypothetical protein B0H17DRAFT_1133968 [Mycena rosella]